MPGPRARSAIQRSFDLVLGIPVAIVAAPVAVVIAAALRLRQGRPVLFRQERAGLHGQAFTVLKFRTMTDERDAGGALLPDEQRVSGIGAFLRSTSLDELPQLINVVRGEMSLVGPRPLPLAYVPRYSASELRRLDVRPGITGWAQVRGRNALAWPEKLALDVWYVDHASVRLDLRIVLQTVRSVRHRDGISADGHATMPEFLGSAVTDEH